MEQNTRDLFFWELPHEYKEKVRAFSVDNVRVNREPFRTENIIARIFIKGCCSSALQDRYFEIKTSAKGVNCSEFSQ